LAIRTSPCPGAKGIAGGERLVQLKDELTISEGSDKGWDVGEYLRSPPERDGLGLDPDEAEKEEDDAREDGRQRSTEDGV
jgi:hypothetical protein